MLRHNAGRKEWAVDLGQGVWLVRPHSGGPQDEP